ncbi:NADAR family protein [Actinomadura sp. GC306]|uniref:NADAR family protein n=1 Tax=Actinomadura sp. GC306 TaxID=2530367 RepID=UPI0010443103|nr:NADAR family protein [Actinomadura sp. GC306]TDC62781.1 NADAR family protein [Actinomadura sp. GC306]
MDVAELVRRQNQGEHLEFVFFWGHETPGPGFLSQWCPSPFTVDGVTYATAEHYMMAEKARLFGDDQRAAAILTSPDPRRAKDLGRRVRNFDERTWKEHRVAIVTRGNEAKFAQHPDMRDYLLSTHPRVLVEASPRDRIWGIGLRADDPRAKTPDSWQGENLLGFALMTTRDALAAA